MIASMKREVRDVAGLHERTVVDAEQHAQTYARSAGRRSERRPRSGRVDVLTVHPDVLKAALKIAGGDASRLQILSATEVRVR